MKIQIEEQGKKYSIVLLIALICRKPILRFVKLFCKDLTIDPNSIGLLRKELRRIKKQYGTWELLDFRSADGESVRIFL